MTRFIKPLLTIALSIFTLSGFSQSTLSSAVIKSAQIGQTVTAPAGITLVASANKQGDGTSCTTSAIDTTGANLIVVTVHEYRVSTPATLSDSKGNTWSAASPALGDGQTGNAIFYCFSPTVGSGHTFSLVGGAGGGSDTTFNALHVFAFSGSTSPGLVGTGTSANAANWSSKQPGSISDSSIKVFVSAATINVAAKTLTINSSFTGLNQGYSSAGTGNGAAYKIGSTAENPTWAITSGLTDGTVSLASFK